MSEIYLRKDFIEKLEPEEVVIYTALKKEIDERYRADENSIIINTSIDWIVNSKLNNFFKVILPVLNWCQVIERRMKSVIVKPIHIISKPQF